MNKQLSELRKQPHWSFSSLNSFINICSLQWAFRYIYKLESETLPVNLLLGSAFHKAASWIALMRKQGIYPTNEEAKNIFTEMFNIELRSANTDKLDSTVDELKELDPKGRQMLECLNSKWIEDNIVSVAKSFSVLLPGTTIPLIGEIDLIVKDDDNRHILVDWKTSARKWAEDKAQKDLQSTCFMYAYEQLNSDYVASDNVFRYDVVTKTKQPTYNQYITYRNKNDFIKLGKLVQTVEKAVKNEIFLPNETSFYCSSCQFKSACKSWHIKQSTTIFPAKAA